MTNIEIQNYYQKESRFHGAYSRDNLPDKVEDGAHVTYLDEYADVTLVKLLCMFQIMMLSILKPLGLNMLHVKSDILLEIKK